METVEFIKKFPLRTFEKGEVLLSEGQQADKLFALRTGFIKVTALHDSGDEKLLWIAGRYDVAPTEQLFSTRGSLQFFYTALTSGSLYDIDKAAFLAYAKSHPELMAEIATSMSLHYDDLLNRVNAIGQTTIRSKLIATLCYLGERLSGSDTVDLFELGLKLTHADIAAMVGSTRETVSLELHTLRTDGCIEYDRNTLLLHLPKLRALAT